MANTPIQIVDENDQPVRSALKKEAWTEGLIHRVVRITIFDTEGRVLVQKRKSSKELYPDCWDNSAAGHVDAGEDYDQAAYRELSEELGITDAKLEPVGNYYSEKEFEWRKLKRFTKVYRATIHASHELILQADEVSDAQWMTIAEVKDLVQNHPDRITDGLQEVATQFL